MSTDGSAAMTRARRELKYLVPKERLGELSQAVATHLPVHVLRTWRDSTPPSLAQAITTVYFDTDDHQLFAMADGSERNVKLRVREYDALHPDMRALADREGAGYDEIVWLELKRRDHDHTEKRRAAIPKPDLAAFLQDGTRSAVMDVIVRETPDTDEVLTKVRAFIDGFDRPLRPACVVNYVRCAWQAADGSVRVTIDRDVAFFGPSHDQFRKQDLTERTSLGPPAGVETSCVVEVKSHGETPVWLTTALADSEAARVDYSKFVAAMRTLLAR